MPLSNPTAPERNLLAVTYDKVKEIRVVDTDDQSKVLAIENLAIAGTKVTVAVEGIDATDVNGALAEHQADIETLGTEKVSTTTEVIAGAGLTGGGTLDGDVTLNVATADDSLVVAADNVKVNTYNGLDSTSTTRPLSAAQGKNLVDADAAIVDDQKAVHPEIAYNKRVIADGGVILRKKQTNELHQEALDILSSAKFMWDGHAGTKRRVSGANTFATKIYSMDGTDNDGVQTTEANQPYLGGLIAKNESAKLLYGTGRTLDVTDVAFAANAAWSFIVVVKPNAPSVIDLGAGSLTLTAAAIKINNGSADILSCVGDNNWGLERIIVFNYQGDGNGTIWIDGVLQTTTTVSGAMTFGEIGFTSGDYSLSGATIFDRKLEAAEVNSLYAFLRSIHPPIETTHVGSQQIATSNLEATVFGGVSIPEMQSAVTEGNAELITDPNFANSAAWTILEGWAVTGGKAVATATTNRIYMGGCAIGKMYEYTVVVDSVSGGDFVVRAGGSLSPNITTAGTHKGKIQSTVDGTIGFDGASAFTGVISRFSVKELGWADLTTPALCHYNNDTDYGAIYGKLYNGYAVPVINAAAPTGFHVPSELEWTQLSESLGGNTVSGGKLKAKWGGFDNAFATNESGVSFIPAGIRLINGDFTYNGYRSVLHIANGYYSRVFYDNTTTDLRNDAGNSFGFSIRLFSNTPYLTTNLYESGWFATDIASTPKSIRIPFGCKVTNIKCVTTTNVTSIEAKLFSYGGTELETLITGKACNATTKSFTVVADQTVSYTDNYVRVTGAGNSGTGMNIIVTIEMI